MHYYPKPLQTNQVKSSRLRVEHSNPPVPCPSSQSAVRQPAFRSSVRQDLKNITLRPHSSGRDLSEGGSPGSPDQPRAGAPTQLRTGRAQRGARPGQQVAGPREPRSSASAEGCSCASPPRARAPRACAPRRGSPRGAGEEGGSDSPGRPERRGRDHPALLRSGRRSSGERRGRPVVDSPVRRLVRGTPQVPHYFSLTRRVSATAGGKSPLRARRGGGVRTAGAQPSPGRPGPPPRPRGRPAVPPAARLPRGAPGSQPRANLRAGLAPRARRGDRSGGAARRLPSPSAAAPRRPPALPPPAPPRPRPGLRGASGREGERTARVRPLRPARPAGQPPRRRHPRRPRSAASGSYRPRRTWRSSAEGPPL
nr:uncharacterized protein LOC110555228 [Meriones unguiculatus]